MTANAALTPTPGRPSHAPEVYTASTQRLASRASRKVTKAELDGPPFPIWPGSVAVEEPGPGLEEEEEAPPPRLRTTPATRPYLDAAARTFPSFCAELAGRLCR